MTPEVGFIAALLGTVVLLGFVAWTGLRARRRLHLVLVVTTVGGLALAIWYALQLGQLYDLEAAGWITPVHLTLARVATAAYLLPAVTGLLTLRDARWRRLHGRFAFLVLGLTLSAALTGAWMMLLAERLPEVAPAL